MADTHNKYTVHQRLSSAEAAIVELRAELARTRTHVVTELKNAVRDTCGRDGRDGVNGVCVCKQGLDGRPGRDGRDAAAGKDGRSIIGPKGDRGEASQVPGPVGPAGKDGQSIVGPQGPQGERGDVLYIGPDDLIAAVAIVKTELLAQRAKFLGAIDQAISDNGGNSGAQRLVRAKLQAVKQDAGLV
jgi:hypothetical protein